MTCFTLVRDKLSLSDQWTDNPEFVWLHALLSYADAHNAGGGDPSTNPFTATIRRLEIAGINPRALARVRFLLANEEARYATSH
jgi:hypothetical protein